MKLFFSIRYNTVWGESLSVEICYKGYDGKNRCVSHLMKTADGSLWTLEVAPREERHRRYAAFAYRYVVVDAGGRVLRREWTTTERLFLYDAAREYIFRDVWRDVPADSHLYTRAYHAAVFRSGCSDETEVPALPFFRNTLLFRVSAPQLLPGQSLALSGSHPSLGSWNTARYLPMTRVGGQEWMLSVNSVALAGQEVEYKYVVIDDTTHALVAWEDGYNRSVDTSDGDGQVTVLDGGLLRLAPRTWRAAGVAVPVFSLSSSHSYGCGDFGDLRRLVDWTVATGMKIIQLLPVNDTGSLRGWLDSCPYNAISAFALHPHYIDLEAAGRLADEAAMTAFERRRQELNSLPYSDYMAVDRVKGDYLWQLFDEQGESVCASAGFKDFVAENGFWLQPYAAFCILRDRCQTADFSRWGDFAEYNEERVEQLLGEEDRQVRFIFYIQYLLHSQLAGVSQYAHSHGVALMADMPCCISRNSVEMWSRPELFRHDAFAGTPPDRWSRNGQNWQQPPFDWDGVERDHYRWWHRRIRHIERYFDAVRLDHVLGYFRIWEIPHHAVYAQLGHFSPSAPYTVAEIEAFGLPFRKNVFTRPYITERIVSRLFGMHAPYVREHYLEPKGYGLYAPRPDYDTQQKVVARFAGRNDEDSIWIRDGLCQLLSDVLFVEDEQRPGTYHPRIEAFREPACEALDPDERDAYMRLYNNYFYQRHNLYWGDEAYRRLSGILDGSRLLVTAEDLGMMPPCVEPVLEALGILPLELQTMPKGDSVYEFAHTGSWPYRSLATISTHDMPTMRQWWEENPARVQRYYTTMLQKTGRAPEHLTPVLSAEIVARHLYSPSMLCVLPIQEWLATDGQLASKTIRWDRINVPNDAGNRWQYKMNVTLETLLEATRFNRRIHELVSRSRDTKE